MFAYWKTFIITWKSWLASASGLEWFRFSPSSSPSASVRLSTMITSSENDDLHHFMFVTQSVFSLFLFFLNCLFSRWKHARRNVTLPLFVVLCAFLRHCENSNLTHRTKILIWNVRHTHQSQSLPFFFVWILSFVFWLFRCATKFKCLYYHFS